MHLLIRNTVMANVLSEYNELIPVLNRFGIKLGVGENTIEALCIAYNLNPALVLAVLNVYINEDFYPHDLDDISTEEIADYFHNTVENYIYELMPNIEKHLNAFIAISGSKNNSNGIAEKKPKNSTENEELNMLNLLFIKFKERMSDQLNNLINYEDDFPDELLHDLKNILIKHLSSDVNQNLCYAVIFSIHSFQKDLAAHNRLRNRVLSPKLNLLNSSDIRHLQHLISNDHPHKPEDGNHHLTKRETEILKLIVKGCINKEIGDMLNISLNTVLTHRKNIIRKTGVKTVSGLTFYCLRNGLINM